MQNEETQAGQAGRQSHGQGMKERGKMSFSIP